MSNMEIAYYCSQCGCLERISESAEAFKSAPRFEMIYGAEWGWKCERCGDDKFLSVKNDGSTASDIIIAAFERAEGEKS